MYICTDAGTNANEHGYGYGWLQQTQKSVKLNQHNINSIHDTCLINLFICHHKVSGEGLSLSPQSRKS